MSIQKRAIIQNTLGMTKKITVVIGPARAGKTTFANWLSRQNGEKTGGTSQIVYKLMANARGCPLEELYRVPKELLRPHLIKFADSLCDIYPDILSAGLLMEGITVIDGIRRREELEELARKHDIEVYYVKRDKGTVKDNFELVEDDADFIVDNNGNMEQFKIFPNPLHRLFK
jgi:hypothetical protein